ncbi:alpha/beta fold hydrolase [Fredinandcohnia humi]
MTKTQSIFKSELGRKQFISAYDMVLEEWTIPFESKFITTKFGDIHVIISGPLDAPPLVLLPGMTGSSTMWTFNISQISEKYRTYCIDTPNDFGKTELTSPILTIDEYEECLNEVVEKLGINKFNLLGHSFGGFLATNYAMNHQEKIKSLLLLAPACSVLPLTVKFYFKVFPAMIFPTTKRILSAWSWFLAKGNNLEILGDTYLNQLVISYTHCRPTNRVQPRVFKDSELQKIKNRTLFLVGAEEVIYPAIKAENRIKNSLENVETHIIPRAGHLVNVEQKELVNKLILDFLDRSHSQ